MLWKRTSKPSFVAPKVDEADRPADIASPSPPAADPSIELDHALDTLAAIFRALGKHAIDLPEVEARATTDLCERWATHLVLRTRVPTDPQDEGEARPQALKREWLAAQHYVTHLRKGEHTYVTKSLQDMRQAIWAFVHGLNRAFVTEGDASQRVKSQLFRLQTAAKGTSTEDLKREAISVAHSIGDIFEERRQRQLNQVAELGERMSELGRALEEARREVTLDPLTRLFNRKTFDEQLTRASDLGGLFRQPACLLLIDLDHFKSVNDGYGHPAGDEVLRVLTGCLVRVFRRRDDVVARYGGEEFGIVLRDTEEKEAIMLATRLLEAVRKLTVDYAGHTLRVTVSVGLAQAFSGEAPEDWLARADRALYDAKQSGRDRLAIAPLP